MKIGLDVHGVIDSDPTFFSEFTNLMKSAGHEIHVLTGEEKTEKLIKQLKEMGIIYDFLFSISTSLMELGHDVKFDEENNPWFKNDLWNSAKGKYCLNNEIDLHFDDSPEYFKYFKTPYVFFTKTKHNVNI